MKLILLFLSMISLSALADETCKTSAYIFRITNYFLEANGPDEQFRIPYNDVRQISRQNSRNDFANLIQELSLTLLPSEIPRIARFTLTVADGSEELLGMKYIKGYDQLDTLLVRFMMTDNETLRCQ